MNKIPTGELLRLACIYAEQDRRSYADALSNLKGASDVKDREEALAFADQIKEYRIKRWGRTKGDRIDEELAKTPTVSMFDLIKKVNSGVKEATNEAPETLGSER